LEVVLFTLMVAGGLFLIWGKKGPGEEKEETVEKELVVAARWPRQKQGRALPQRLVVENLATEHLVGDQLVGNQIGAGNRLAENRPGGNVLAEKASAASTASLLALSHIYTASSKGGDAAPTAEEPVTKQQASTGG
jgi:hypothetical protein